MLIIELLRDLDADSEQSRADMALFAETPQTQIARCLSELLEKRINRVQMLRKHRYLEFRDAETVLWRLHKILRDSRDLQINNVHEKISNKFLDDWLWRFKGFFYTTEDMLDDLHFIESPSGDDLSASVHFLEKAKEKLLQGDDLSAFEQRMHIFKKAMEKLREIIDASTGLFREIKDVMEGMEEFEPIYSRLEKQHVTSSKLPTLPYKVRELKGRAAEKKKILEALFHKDEGESKESPVMISITGPVGIGKTDLARAVYNSAQVEAEFDVRAWIYMGKEDDCWLTLQRSESASVDQPSELKRFSNGSSMDNILDIMETEMEDKKVLIVLDNLAKMWFLNGFNMVHIRRRFMSNKSSAIIVTTQSEYFGRLISKSLNVELDGLEKEEYLELFKECALGHRNRNKYPKLEDIVGEIAKRFGGNPLAAVMIGRHLKSHQSEDRWRTISQSNLGKIDPTESNIISVLKYSYEKLPADLKLCYLACALFPKNYPFKEKQLFSIWSAIGCSSHTSTLWSQTCKDIGSFFVSSARKDGEFILHAIFHELADYISDGEFFRLEDAIKEEDDVVQIPEKARHVYVTADNFVKVYRVLQEKTHLRSLVICGVLSSEEHKSSFMGLLEEVLRNLKGLRLLMISVLPTGKLPDAIGGLRHLRYLELPIDTITEESIQELPTWLYDPGFVGLRQLQNLEELRGAIRKLQSGESSHTFKSIDKELSSRESSDPSVLPPLKFSKHDSEVSKKKTK